MEALERALEPYRHLDPLGWVDLFRALPPWGGAVAMGVGVAMMLFGGRSLFRVVAGPLGYLIATVWAAPLAARLGVSGNLKQVTLITTYALLVAGLLWPPIVIFLAFGVPAGLLGGELAGPNDWLLGFGPGLLLGGALGLILHRVVGAVLSALVGSWVFVLGVMAVLHPFVGAIDWLAQRPPVVVVVAACFAAGGAVFQLLVRLSPEQARSRKAERALARRKAEESQAMEARWAKHQGRK